jgi:hypothetical protein
MSMSPVEVFRMEIGDDDGSLFTEPQAEHLIEERSGVVLEAAADACDILATRFAKEFDFNSAARMQFRRSQKSEAYERRAAALRKRIGGLTVVPMTRTDAYSDDVSVRDGAGEGSNTGRIRKGYTDPDLAY